MKSNLIITISREFGSGGHLIGEKLAEELNVPFYDEAIIERAAMKSGFDKNFIEEQEEKINNSLLFNIATSGYYAGGTLHDQIFIAECFFSDTHWVAAFRSRYKFIIREGSKKINL